MDRIYEHITHPPTFVPSRRWYNFLKTPQAEVVFLTPEEVELMFVWGGETLFYTLTKLQGNFETLARHDKYGLCDRLAKEFDVLLWMKSKEKFVLSGLFPRVQSQESIDSERRVQACSEWLSTLYTLTTHVTSTSTSLSSPIVPTPTIHSSSSSDDPPPSAEPTDEPIQL